MMQIIIDFTGTPDGKKERISKVNKLELNEFNEKSREKMIETKIMSFSLSSKLESCSLAIVITIVQSSFFLSSSFDPLRAISRVRKFVSPNILA